MEDGTLARTPERRGRSAALVAFLRQKRRERAARGTFAPWMKFMEIEVLEEVLTRLAPCRCLEWGAGYSTLKFPHLIPGGATWLSVEHDSEWAGKVAALVDRPGVTVHHVPPDRYPWTDANGDGAANDLARYIEFPTEFAPFDFILVDGRARTACLTAARELLSATGVVVLHDAHREYYQDGVSSYERQLRLRFHDRRARGRRARVFWIGSRGRPIEDVLDVVYHRRVWRLYDAVGTFVKVV
jgi:predicted O-methyltransferase YrrM